MFKKLKVGMRMVTGERAERGMGLGEMFEGIEMRAVK